MTFPPYMYMKNRAAFFGCGDGLEFNAVFNLAHMKFSRGGISDGDDDDNGAAIVTTAPKNAMTPAPPNATKLAPHNKRSFASNDDHDSEETASHYDATDEDDGDDVFQNSPPQAQDPADAIATVTTMPYRHPPVLTKKPKKQRTQQPPQHGRAPAPAAAVAAAQDDEDDPRRPSRSSSTLPTTDDPRDPTFSMSLYTPSEEGKINPTHILVRRHVLAVHRTVSREIYFECRCCMHRPRSDRAKQSVLAPQSISSLYRAVIRFMMYHVPECADIPREIKERSPKTTKEATARGTKQYWVKSARKIGLKDRSDGTGIVFCEEIVGLSSST